jgi:hypothetical protein
VLYLPHGHLLLSYSQLYFEGTEGRQTMPSRCFQATFSNSVRFASTSPAKSLRHVSSGRRKPLRPPS